MALFHYNLTILSSHSSYFFLYLLYDRSLHVQFCFFTEDNLSLLIWIHLSSNFTILRFSTSICRKVVGIIWKWLPRGFNKSVKIRGKKQTIYVSILHSQNFIFPCSLHFQGRSDLSAVSGFPLVPKGASFGPELKTNVSRWKIQKTKNQIQTNIKKKRTVLPD